LSQHSSTAAELAQMLPVVFEQVQASRLGISRNVELPKHKPSQALIATKKQNYVVVMYEQIKMFWKHL